MYRTNSSSLDALQQGQESFLTRVWNDEAYRERLREDPEAAIAEIGGRIPDGFELKVVFDSDEVTYLHLPAPPSEGEVRDEELLGAQGGTVTFAVSGTIVSVTVVVVTSTLGRC